MDNGVCLPSLGALIQRHPNWVWIGIAKAISAALGSDEASGVFGENAARILKLSRPE